MATLAAAPSWKPSPVTTLPIMTTVTFSVDPGGNKLQVVYELRSPELQFQAGGQPAELPLSQPMPSPSNRGQSRIVDIVDNLGGGGAGPSRTMVTRALAIEQAGAVKPAIATISVTVCDFDTGAPVRCDNDSNTIPFTIP